VRADVLRKRREGLGLQPRPQEADLGVPPQVAALSAKSEDQRWLEGGVVLLGRPALKEYLAGLRAGWRNGVDAWTWEKEIEDQIEWDTVFQTWVPPTEGETDPAVTPAPAAARTSIFSRAAAPPRPTAAVGPGAAVPPQWHAAPAQLPAHPPLLLVPWTNYLGFGQIPYMIYNFFTERERVKEGAEAAYALITNQTRAFEGPKPRTEDAHLAPELPSDLDFGLEGERFYKSDYEKVPQRQAKQRQDYYRSLGERLESARAFARGERELTDEEKASDKPVVTEDDLKAERRKRELRWRGGREGWEIVRPKTAVAWEDAWAGWLRVFDARTADEIAEAERKRNAAMEK
jgi:import inner membrane translocase subunit TIM54